jgi:hypothetical protein
MKKIKLEEIKVESFVIGEQKNNNDSLSCAQPVSGGCSEVC